jgi:hypothetical protein
MGTISKTGFSLSSFDFEFIFGNTFAKRKADRLKPVLLNYNLQFGTLTEV